jgi:hypothetical protein
MALATRLVRPSKLRVRAPRVPIDLEVESRTIGTSAAYSLYTEDISRSGLLLIWDREVKMPFIVNTLLELTIDPRGSCLDKPVSCLGKVVRREASSADGKGHQTRLGIQIVQIDNTDLSAWEGCLSELEKRFGIEMTNKISTGT